MFFFSIYLLIALLFLSFIFVFTSKHNVGWFLGLSARNFIDFDFRIEWFSFGLLFRFAFFFKKSVCYWLNVIFSLKNVWRQLMADNWQLQHCSLILTYTYVSYLIIMFCFLVESKRSVMCLCVLVCAICNVL